MEQPDAVETSFIESIDEFTVQSAVFAVSLASVPTSALVRSPIVSVIGAVIVSYVGGSFLTWLTPRKMYPTVTGTLAAVTGFLLLTKDYSTAAESAGAIVNIVEFNVVLS